MENNKIYKISWDSHTIELGKQTRVMGILNVTPDSFSDGGKFFKIKNALAHAEKMVEDGADIIDIGGESTRPFSKNVTAEEEIRRVVPVIEQLVKQVPVPISIDTTKADVARRAIETGASIINDVGALRLDPDMAGIAAKYQVPIILMHMKDTPRTMQVSPAYDDLISDIKMFLKSAVAMAIKSGISKSNLIIDPGIGFGKTFEHNLQMLKHLNEFHDLNLPILVGPSRKAFIRNILKHKSDKDIAPDLPVVETGTQAAVAAAALQGAHIIRAHDVANTVATIKIIDAIKNVAPCVN